MTPEAQRIAIAEWCGWSLQQTNVHDGKCWHLNGVQCEEAPPDYYNDLNAIHESEERLDPHQVALYGMNISTLMDSSGEDDGPELQICDWHATAPQRCEALLRTLNLWKDTP